MLDEPILEVGSESNYRSKEVGSGKTGGIQDFHQDTRSDRRISALERRRRNMALRSHGVGSRCLHHIRGGRSMMHLISCHFDERVQTRLKETLHVVFHHSEAAIDTSNLDRALLLRTSEEDACRRWVANEQL